MSCEVWKRKRELESEEESWKTLQKKDIGWDNNVEEEGKGDGFEKQKGAKK